MILKNFSESYKLKNAVYNYLQLQFEKAVYNYLQSQFEKKTVYKKQQIHFKF